MKRFGSVWSDLVSEAPIDHIEAAGDFSKAQSFRRPADRALVSTPARFEKIKAAWAKVPETFNIYFLNQKGAGKHVEHGVAGEELLKQLNVQIKQSDFDAINLVFTNNLGDQWRAMTPWIMAHRFGHVVQAASRKGGGRMFGPSPGGNATINDQWNELQKYVDTTFAELGQCYGFNIQPTDIMRSKEARAVAMGFCTFRSARERNLRNYTEAWFELFAQYLLTGAVKLNPPPRMVITNFAWGHPQGRSLRSDKTAEAAEIVDEFASNYEAHANSVLSACLGHTFVM